MAEEERRVRCVVRRAWFEPFDGHPTKAEALDLLRRGDLFYETEIEYVDGSTERDRG